MRSSETTIAFASAFAPPERPVPAPRATTLSPSVGGESHGGCDVIGRLRQDDGERTVVLGPLRVVVRVIVESRRVGDDLIVRGGAGAEPKRQGRRGRRKDQRA